MSDCIRNQKKPAQRSGPGKCLVFGSSKISRTAFIRRYADINEPVTVLCADGGLRNALRAGFFPDAVIGDMDSGSDDLPDGTKVIRLPREKDKSDLQACLDYGLIKGYKYFILLGCTGGRLDHHMANTYLLEYLAENGARGILADAYNEIYYHSPGQIKFEKDRAFKYLSVLALDKELTGVTLKGLKYPLNEACIKRSSSLGLSNEYAGKGPATVITKKGKALIIRSKDPK